METLSPLRRRGLALLEELHGGHAGAAMVAELADVRVIAAVGEGAPIGYAQVETHDGGSEVTHVFVHPAHRGRGLGGALTTRAIRVAADAAPHVWICAERDNRPRRLYERLGFRTGPLRYPLMERPRPAAG